MSNIFEQLKGMVFTNISGMKEGSEEVVFKTLCGKVFKMHHYQDCCEEVYLCDVCGDVEDLLNSPIIHFEERTEVGEETEYTSSTYTFYDIQTTKGSVNLRWFGESNGYYSEDVDFVEV